MTLHHHHDDRPAVVEERDGGPATAMLVVLVLAVVGVLIWLFAFSGIVFDNDNGSDTGPVINNEQNVPQDNDGGMGGAGGGESDPGTQSDSGSQTQPTQ